PALARYDAGGASTATSAAILASISSRGIRLLCSIEAMLMSASVSSTGVPAVMGSSVRSRSISVDLLLPPWASPAPGEASQAALGEHPAGCRSLAQCRVVAFVLIGISGSEVGDRPVERVRVAEVGGDRDPVARARVRARQRPGTDLAVIRY